MCIHPCLFVTLSNPPTPLPRGTHWSTLPHLPGYLGQENRYHLKNTRLLWPRYLAGTSVCQGVPGTPVSHCSVLATSRLFASTLASCCKTHTRACLRVHLRSLSACPHCAWHVNHTEHSAGLGIVAKAHWSRRHHRSTCMSWVWCAH